MRNAIKILVLFCICTATTCRKKEDSENCHYAIEFSNNFEKNLRVRPSMYVYNIPNSCGIRTLSYIYNTATDDMYLVRRGEQNNRKATEAGGCVESLFAEHYADTLNIYIFDAEVIENTPWETVVRDYLVLKRYDLSLSDLQRLNWQVTYPPTEAMKDIQQWPEYGSD